MRLRATYAQNVLKLGLSSVSNCLSKFDERKKFAVQFSNYKPLKLSWVFLTGHTVDFVTYRITKMVTFLPMIRKVSDSMTAASADKEWLRSRIKI